MIYILKRFFGRQRKVIAIAPSSYVPDTWYVTFMQSDRFTIQWLTRYVKHGETRLMERAPDGHWYQIQEPGDDDLDDWLWSEIVKERQRRWNRVIDDVHIMA